MVQHIPNNVCFFYICDIICTFLNKGLFYINKRLLKYFKIVRNRNKIKRMRMFFKTNSWYMDFDMAVIFHSVSCYRIKCKVLYINIFFNPIFWQNEGIQNYYSIRKVHGKLSKWNHKYMFYRLLSLNLQNVFLLVALNHMTHCYECFWNGHNF